MHLTGKQRILRYIRPARVFAQGQEEKPDNANDDAEKREEVWEADEEEVRVTPQIAGRDWHCCVLVDWFRSGGSRGRSGGDGWMGRGVRLSEARGRMGYAHVLKPLIHRFKSSELSFHAVRSARRTWSRITGL